MITGTPKNLDSRIDMKRWYALQVRSRHEKSVFRELERSGLNASLPLIVTVRRWSDRKKKIKVPLFTGYVFVELALNVDRFNVLRIPGVVRFVGLRGSPVAIPTKQMYWLDKIMQEENVSAHVDYPEGSMVTVAEGPLRGLRGTVLKRKAQSRLIVWFEVIMQGLAVDIDQAVLKAPTARMQVHSGE